jgi:hypothetical protein
VFSTGGNTDGLGVGGAIDDSGTRDVAGSGNHALRKNPPRGCHHRRRRAARGGHRLGSDERRSKSAELALVGPKQLAVLTADAAVLVSRP